MLKLRTLAILLSLFLSEVVVGTAFLSCWVPPGSLLPFLRFSLVMYLVRFIGGDFVIVLLWILFFTSIFFSLFSTSLSYLAGCTRVNVGGIVFAVSLLLVNPVFHYVVSVLGDYCCVLSLSVLCFVLYRVLRGGVLRLLDGLLLGLATLLHPFASFLGVVLIALYLFLIGRFRRSSLLFLLVAASVSAVLTVALTGVPTYVPDPWVSAPLFLMAVICGLVTYLLRVDSVFGWRGYLVLLLYLVVAYCIGSYVPVLLVLFVLVPDLAVLFLNLLRRSFAVFPNRIVVDVPCLVIVIFLVIVVLCCPYAYSVAFRGYPDVWMVARFLNFMRGVEVSGAVLCPDVYFSNWLYSVCGVSVFPNSSDLRSYVTWSSPYFAATRFVTPYLLVDFSDPFCGIYVPLIHVFREGVYVPTLRLCNDSIFLKVYLNGEVKYLISNSSTSITRGFSVRGDWFVHERILLSRFYRIRQVTYVSKVSPCVVVEFHMRSRVRVSLAHVILKLYPYYVYIDKLCIRHLSRAFLELDYRGVRVAVLVSGFGPITNITVVPGGLNLTYLVNSTSCVLGFNVTFLDAEYSGLGSQVVDVVDLLRRYGVRYVFVTEEIRYVPDVSWGFAPCLVFSSGCVLSEFYVRGPVERVVEYAYGNLTVVRYCVDGVCIREVISWGVNFVGAEFCCSGFEGVRNVVLRFDICRGYYCGFDVGDGGFSILFPGGSLRVDFIGRVVNVTWCVGEGGALSISATYVVESGDVFGFYVRGCGVLTYVSSASGLESVAVYVRRSPYTLTRCVPGVVRLYFVEVNP